MTTNTERATNYAIVHPDDAEDAYAGSVVPGEFRSLADGQPSVSSLSR